MPPSGWPSRSREVASRVGHRSGIETGCWWEKREVKRDIESGARGRTDTVSEGNGFGDRCSNGR